MHFLFHVVKTNELNIFHLNCSRRRGSSRDRDRGKDKEKERERKRKGLPEIKKEHLSGKLLA